MSKFEEKLARRKENQRRWRGQNVVDRLAELLDVLEEGSKEWEGVVIALRVAEKLAYGEVKSYRDRVLTHWSERARPKLEVVKGL